MSNCIIRVKREATPAKDDAFEDVITNKQSQISSEKLIARILKENEDLLQELTAEEGK